MARQKRARSVNVGKIFSTGNLVNSLDWGYFVVHLHTEDADSLDPGRPVSVYFRNYRTARAVARDIIKWADECEALGRDDY